nr:DUF5059 domain-containing protein [Natrinema gelatinilyticum]
MQRTRRAWLKGSGATILTLGLAGCTSPFDAEQADSDTETVAPAEIAVAAEWNAIRARVWDAYALGRAGHEDSGAAVAQRIFGRFERASGENNAHEMLEETSEPSYAEFEEALGEFRSTGLQASDRDRAGEETTVASTQLEDRPRVHDAAWLFQRGQPDAAKRIVETVTVFAHFEGARAHEALEEASEDAYHEFEDDGLGSLTTAIENDDAKGVGTGVEPALLEAGFFKARVGRSRRLGERDGSDSVGPVVRPHVRDGRRTRVRLSPPRNGRHGRDDHRRIATSNVTYDPRTPGRRARTRQ